MLRPRPVSHTKPRGRSAALAAVLSFGLLAPQTGCLAASHGAYLLRGPAALTAMNIDFPPMDIPPATATVPLEQPDPLWTVSAVDGWVHGFTVELTDADGDPVPPALLHHVKVMMPSKRELFNPIMLRLIGAGSETREVRTPRSVGFPIQSGDSLVATAMIHNAVGAGYQAVRLRLRLEVTPALGSPRPQSVYPFFLHVTSAADNSEFDLPPGRSEQNWEASPVVAGEIVAFGGHTHRYATELRFEDAASGRILWRSRVRTDPDGNVLEIPRTIYKTSRGPTIVPERVYRLTVVYDNPTGETIAGGGMGTMGGVLKPRSEWPMVNREDPLYVLDRERELSGVAVMAEHHHR